MELSALVRRKIFLGPISDQKVVGNTLQMPFRNIDGASNAPPAEARRRRGGELSSTE